MNFHKGNVYFRKLVSVLRNEYVATPKSEKPFFAKMVQEHIRSLNPPGRFLKRDSKADPYVDVGEKPSIDKTSQALREGKPAIEKKIKSGEWIIENVSQFLFMLLSQKTHQIPHDLILKLYSLI